LNGYGHPEKVSPQVCPRSQDEFCPQADVGRGSDGEA
jgi:hypothetical protein